MAGTGFSFYTASLFSSYSSSSSPFSSGFSNPSSNPTSIASPIFSFGFGSGTTSSNTAAAETPFGGSSIFGSSPSPASNLFGSSTGAGLTSNMFGSSSASGSTPTSSLFGSGTTPSFGSSASAITSSPFGSSISGSAPSSTNIFGSATAQSLFGSSTVASASSPFGSSLSGPASSSNLFGSVSTPNILGSSSAAPSSIPFGSPSLGTGHTASMFGSTSATAAGSPSPSSSPFGTPTLFASPAPGSSNFYGFGNAPSSIPFVLSSGASNSSNTTPSFGMHNLFGSSLSASNAANTAPLSESGRIPTSSMFGSSMAASTLASTQPAFDGNSPAGGLSAPFTSTSSTTVATVASMGNTPSFGSSFWSTLDLSGSYLSMFGSSPATLFGSLSSSSLATSPPLTTNASSSASSAPGFSFATASSQLPSFGSSSASTLGFTGSSSIFSSAPAPLFGSLSSSTTTTSFPAPTNFSSSASSAPGFSLSSASGSPGFSFPAASATGVGTATTTFAASFSTVPTSASSGFSFLKSTTSLASGATSSSSSPSFGTTGFQSSALTSPLSSVPSFASTTATGSNDMSSAQTMSSLVVSSSSGTTSTTSAALASAPKLPSEITGRTVEEIIKGWNAELQEWTGKFHKQANAIAEWDRRILQNRDICLTLESEVAKVVETQGSLEQQLELIETYQDEVHKALQSMEEEAERIYKEERGLLLDDEAASTRDAIYEQAEMIERELEHMTEQIKSTINTINANKGGELDVTDGMTPLEPESVEVLEPVKAVAPLQIFFNPTILPPARPIGMAIQEFVESTWFGLDIKSPAKGKDKEKALAMDANPDRPVNAIQIQIDLIMDEVLEYAETKTDEVFDAWFQFRTDTPARKLKKKESLSKFIALEETVMHIVKAVKVSVALERRQYFFDLMRVKKLTEICAELKTKYDPTAPTANDDRVIFTQLDNDLITVQGTVKFWEMDQQLLISLPHKSSKSKSKIQAEESMRMEGTQGHSSEQILDQIFNQEKEQTESTELEQSIIHQTEHIFDLVPEVQMGSEPVEEVSLLNIDDILNNVTQDIAAQVIQEDESMEIKEVGTFKPVEVDVVDIEKDEPVKALSGRIELEQRVDMTDDEFLVHVEGLVTEAVSTVTVEQSSEPEVTLLHEVVQGDVDTDMPEVVAELINLVDQPSDVEFIGLMFPPIQSVSCPIQLSQISIPEDFSIYEAGKAKLKPKIVSKEQTDVTSIPVEPQSVPETEMTTDLNLPTEEDKKIIEDSVEEFSVEVEADDIILNNGHSVIKEMKAFEDKEPEYDKAGTSRALVSSSLTNIEDHSNSPIEDDKTLDNIDARMTAISSDIQQIKTCQRLDAENYEILRGRLFNDVSSLAKQVHLLFKSLATVEKSSALIPHVVNSQHDIATKLDTVAAKVDYIDDKFSKKFDALFAEMSSMNQTLKA